MDENCKWELEEGQVCNEPAVGSVRLKDRILSVRVPVCSNHKAEHRRKAAALRTSARASRTA
jgi:hypothetical protein